MELIKIITRYESDTDNSICQNNTDRVYFVSKKDVDNMITATFRLHYEPGINPHNNKKADKIKMLKIELPTKHSYWWTSADLTDQNPEQKAEIFEFGFGPEDVQIIFASKEIVNEYEKILYQESLQGSKNNFLRWATSTEIKRFMQRINKKNKIYIYPTYKYLISNTNLTNIFDPVKYVYE